MNWPHPLRAAACKVYGCVPNPSVERPSGAAAHLGNRWATRGAHPHFQGLRDDPQARPMLKSGHWMLPPGLALGDRAAHTTSVIERAIAQRRQLAGGSLRVTGKLTEHVPAFFLLEDEDVYVTDLR